MDLQFIDEEKFVHLPVSTRCLYYELLHKTNDDNVCTEVATVLKRGNYPYVALEILIKKVC